MKLVGRYSERDEAQDLMWDAMELVYDEPEKAEQLCNRALKIYPDCVDALTMLAEIKIGRLCDFVESLRQAVAAGRRDLGPKFFKKNAGIFWGILETRPFMRAMSIYADSLLQWGVPEAVDEAITVYEEMIYLNPDDNQGVRDWLARLYLQCKRYDDADKLFQQYHEDWLAAPFWARVLHAYVTRGPDAAAEILPEARKRNEYVEEYLTGRKRRPRKRPSHYSPGDEYEGVYCADMLWEAWKKHPKAKKWLKDIITS